MFKTLNPKISFLAAAMRRTARVMPRRTLPGYWWAGRDDAAWTDPTPSPANCLETRRVLLPWHQRFCRGSGARIVRQLSSRNLVFLARFHGIAEDFPNALDEWKRKWIIAHSDIPSA
jgi:hypothetical protein